MDEEIVRLVGGPGDGKRYGWRGGDTMKFAAMPLAPEIITALCEPGRPTLNEIIYRRHPGTSFFFHEPTKGED